MTDQVISPLRRRMIEDMTIRKFAPKTQHTTCKGSRTSRRSSAALPIRLNRKTCADSGCIWRRAAAAPKINATVSALRFFFNVALDRPDLAKHLAFMHEPRKVPVVLSPEEVARFLEAAPSVKYKAALSVAYGAGLRVSEIVSLKVSDVDSERMITSTENFKADLLVVFIAAPRVRPDSRRPDPSTCGRSSK